VYITDDTGEIELIRKSELYRGYISETEISEPDAPSPPVFLNKVSEKAAEEIVREEKKKTKPKKLRGMLL